MTPSDATLASLGAATYIRLTTFRKTGEAVETAVWVVRDGERLIVTTGSESGKVKRLRHTSRVELTPCDRAGKVAEGAATVTASAVVDSSEDTRSRLDELLLEKYGLQYRAIRAAGKLRGPSTSTAVAISAN